MCAVEDLQVPRTIVAGGKHLLKGVITGTTFGVVTDDNGNYRRVSVHAVLVSDLGTNRLFVTVAMQQGVVTMVHEATPRLESRDMVIPILTYGVDDATGKLMCSIEVKLRVAPGARWSSGEPLTALL